MKELLITPIEKCTGIYGIYINERLVYIGKTTTSFKERFEQHKRKVEDPAEGGSQAYMYWLLHDAKERGDRISLRPIFVVEQNEYDSLYLINNRDIESMEFFAIKVLKPTLNICGNIKPYKYTN